MVCRHTKAKRCGPRAGVISCAGCPVLQKRLRMRRISISNGYGFAKRRRGRGQLCHEIGPVQPRHLNVQQHKIRLLLAGLLKA